MTSIRGPSFSSTSAKSDIHTDVGAGRLRARKYIFVVGGMQNLEDYQGQGNRNKYKKATRNSLTKCAPYYFGSDMVRSSSSGIVRGSGKRMLVVRVDAFQRCHIIITLGMWRLPLDSIQAYESQYDALLAPPPADGELFLAADMFNLPLTCFYLLLTCFTCSMHFSIQAHEC
jgi:hypothetical protein